MIVSFIYNSVKKKSCSNHGVNVEVTEFLENYLLISIAEFKCDSYAENFWDIRKKNIRGKFSEEILEKISGVISNETSEKKMWIYFQIPNLRKTP